MRINEVTTAKKIGKFVLRNDGANKIKVEYLPQLDPAILIDESARVYIFVQDGEIKKIGGSIQRGGIKGTMSFYANAMQGSPGRPRFIIHLLIAEALEKGSKVDIFIIRSPKIEGEVSGLFGNQKMEIASFKEMEELCLSEYFGREKKYPDWNFQENKESYRLDLEEKYQEYHRLRVNRNKRNRT